MSNEIIGQRLAEWRKSSKLSQRALGAALDVSQGFISDIEKGRVAPSRNFLQILFATYRVNPSWILEGQGAQVVDQEPDRSMLGVPMSDFVQVREYSAHLSAGPGAISGPVEVIGEFAFRSSWLRQLTNSPGECYLVRVKGDSMEPTIPDGAVVLIDQQQRDPRQRRKGIFALRIEDEVLVKRLELVDDTLLVESDNPEYSTRLVSRPKPPQVDILGKVIWQSSTLPDQ